MKAIRSPLEICSLVPCMQYIDGAENPFMHSSTMHAIHRRCRKSIYAAQGPESLPQKASQKVWVFRAGFQILPTSTCQVGPIRCSMSVLTMQAILSCNRVVQCVSVVAACLESTAIVSMPRSPGLGKLSCSFLCFADATKTNSFADL